jgi:predicted alpha/beta hydrolase family esterase
MADDKAGKVRVVLVPGNGCDGNLRDCNYYGAAEALLTSRGFDAQLKPMPDPLLARESVWLPFIADVLGADERSVLVGHSSGAAAALRFAESHKLRGLVLLAAYDSDLGDEDERASGYFSRPFDWQRIAANCSFIVQFAGARDRLVPVSVQRRVSELLGPAVEYLEYPRGDHFFAEAGFPEELVSVIERRLSYK